MAIEKSQNYRGFEAALKVRWRYTRACTPVKPLRFTAYPYLGARHETHKSCIACWVGVVENVRFAIAVRNSTTAMACKLQHDIKNAQIVYMNI